MTVRLWRVKHAYTGTTFIVLAETIEGAIRKAYRIFGKRKPRLPKKGIELVEFSGEVDA